MVRGGAVRAPERFGRAGGPVADRGSARLIALTSNGFLTALLFVVYRSPDILLTQILIETVSTIFILLILYFMPPFKADAFTAMTRVTNLDHRRRRGPGHVHLHHAEHQPRVP